MQRRWLLSGALEDEEGFAKRSGEGSDSSICRLLKSGLASHVCDAEWAGQAELFVCD